MADFEARCRRRAGSALRAIPLDLAALIYTSGSTGRPKGVMMTHQSMVFAAGSVAEYLRLGSEDRILAMLPLAFDYGLYQLLMSVRMVATLLLERSFVYPAGVLKRLEEEQATVFPECRPSTRRSCPCTNGAHSSSQRPAAANAAALPPSFHDFLHEIFPNALIFRMYGLTECNG